MSHSIIILKKKVKKKNKKKEKTTSSLPIKKTYCDTKFRRFDSKSTSDFKIDLPQTIKLPDNCVCYIDDVSIPRTWYTVESGVNDKLYFRLQFANGGAYYDYIITLESKIITVFNLQPKFNPK